MVNTVVSMTPEPVAARLVNTTMTVVILMVFVLVLVEMR